MPRTFSTNVTISRNQIDGSNPWTFLFRVTIQGAPGQLRFTDNNEAITFNGMIFDPYPIQLEPLSESSDGSLQRFRATFSNVDQQFMSLLENYWVSGAANWVVEIWQCDALQVNETPITMKEEFDVMSVTTDLLTAVIELQASEISLTTLLPLRRYTPTGGFPFIPRIG